MLSNTYHLHMTGDVCHLPYLGQMGMLAVDEDEEILVEREDLTSCFNLFRLPSQWLGYSAFSKTMSTAVFGGPATEQAYVGMQGRHGMDQLNRFDADRGQVTGLRTERRSRIFRGLEAQVVPPR